MLQLGAIAYPDPVIDQKVKFFHDCFHYYLSEGVKHIEGFPENHLTYLDRMLFRVETLTQMHQSTRMVLCSMLNQQEFDTHTDKFSKQPTINSLVSRLKDLSSRTGNRFNLNEFKDITTEIIILLNGEKGLDGITYFENILQSQISQMLSPHDLAEHKDEIKQNSRWLVAEYLRFGFDSKTLSGSNGVFKRILRYEDFLTGKKSHVVGFPQPQESTEDGLIRSRENNNFVSQFEGMLNLLKEEPSGDIYLKVDGVQMYGQDSFIFTYAGVTLMSFDQIPLDTIALDDNLMKDFKDFYGGANSLIAKVSLNFRSARQAVSKAIYQTQRALDALHYVLDGKGSRVLTNRIAIFRADGKIDYTLNSDRILSIHSHDIELLDRWKNTIIYPDSISEDVKRYLDQCNRIFFKGLNFDDADDIITYFWLYWETSFSFYEKNESNKGTGKAEYIIDYLKSILSKDRVKDLKIRIGLMISNYAKNNCGNKDVGIPSSYYGVEFDFKDPEKTVTEVKLYSDYPFLRMLVEKFETLSDAEEESRWGKFYCDFLWQLYEQRNFIHHDGNFCPATLERLKFYFKSVVINWQAKLYEDLTAFPYSSIQHAVERLKKDQNHV